MRENSEHAALRLPDAQPQQVGRAARHRCRLVALNDQ